VNVVVNDRTRSHTADEALMRKPEERIAHHEAKLAEERAARGENAA